MIYFSHSIASYTRNILFPMVSTLLILLPLNASVYAADDSVVTKQELNKLIREYIIENPDVIEEALLLQNIKRRQQEVEAAKAVVREQAETLFNSKNHIVVGNPDGDVTLVEFYDYNCGYCKRALEDLNKLLADDKDLRVVLKEFPILGPPSAEAAQVAAAVSILAPEKYLEFHQNLMSARGRASEASAMAAAVALGLSEDDLRKNMASEQNKAWITEAVDLARKLNISGTPAFVVGEEVISGAVGYEALKEKIAQIRGKS